MKKVYRLLVIINFIKDNDRDRFTVSNLKPRIATLFFLILVLGKKFLTKIL